MKKLFALLISISLTFGLNAQQRWSKLYTISRGALPYDVSTLKVAPMGENQYLLYGTINGKLEFDSTSTYIDALHPNSLTASAYALQVKDDKKVSVSLPATVPAEGSEYLVGNGKTYLLSTGGVEMKDSVINISTPLQKISRGILYHSQCGTEGCVGLSFLSHISHDSILWTADYDAVLRELITPSGEILLYDSYWEGDSVFVNDTQMKTGGSGLFMIRLDSNGKTIGLTGEDIQNLNNSNFSALYQQILAGQTGEYVTGNFKDSIRINQKTYRDSGYHQFVVKYNILLEPQWVKITGTGENTGVQYSLDNNDNLYIIGSTAKKGIKIGNEMIKTFGNDSLTAYIYKIDKDGNDVSTWFYPQPGSIRFYAAPDGSFYVTSFQSTAWGQQSYSGRGFYLYHLDANGNIMPHNVRLPYSLDSNSSASVQSLFTENDGVVLLLSLPTGKTVNGPDTINITFSRSDIKDAWLLMKVADWEFTGVQAQTKARDNINVYYARQYLNIKGKAKQVHVFDVEGREVYAAELDGTEMHQLRLHLKPGAYIYSITDGENMSNGKFMVRE